MIAFSEDGRLLATAGSGNRAISIIDIATGNELRALSTSTTDITSASERPPFLNTIDPQTLADFKSRGINSPDEIVDAIEALARSPTKSFQSAMPLV